MITRSYISLMLVVLIATPSIISMDVTPPMPADTAKMKSYFNRLKHRIRCYFKEADKETINRTVQSIILTLIALAILKPWQLVTPKKSHKSKVYEVPYSLQCEAEAADNYFKVHIQISNLTAVNDMLNEAKNKNYIQCWQNNFTEYVVKAIDTALQPIPHHNVLEHPHYSFAIIRLLLKTAHTIHAPLDVKSITNAINKEYIMTDEFRRTINKERESLANIDITTYEPQSIEERKETITKILQEEGINNVAFAH